MSEKTFFIPMPPPNITGKLHLGHALFLTLQDILIRYHRIQGDSTLWLPGTDHAGLATHDKILQYFKNNGLSYDKNTYLEKGWDWKDEHHSIITSQIKKMGASCDWSRERFTLDTQYQNSCIEALKLCKDIIYYEDGQWFLDMKSFAQDLIFAIENKEINIIPATETGQLLNFLRNIEPWCISRQIWWGQQLPIYYAGDISNYCIASNRTEAAQILSTEEKKY
jgi:valyl-tRNA synthetase